MRKMLKENVHVPMGIHVHVGDSLCLLARHRCHRV